jgi:hypothetical protein
MCRTGPFTFPYFSEYLRPFFAEWKELNCDDTFLDEYSEANLSELNLDLIKIRKRELNECKISVSRLIKESR